MISTQASKILDGTIRRMGRSYFTPIGDLREMEKIRNAIRAKKLKEAWRRIERADSDLRDQVPSSVYNWLYRTFSV
jgi:hypothetical protein